VNFRVDLVISPAISWTGVVVRPGYRHHSSCAAQFWWGIPSVVAGSIVPKVQTNTFRAATAGV